MLYCDWEFYIPSSDNLDNEAQYRTWIWLDLEYKDTWTKATSAINLNVTLHNVTYYCLNPKNFYAAFNRTWQTSYVLKITFLVIA